MMKNLCCALLTIGSVSLSGCGAEVGERGQRVGVSGQVIFDGQPLTKGRIVFVSDEGAGAVKATALIENGTYAIDEKRGPLASSARVEIHPEILDLGELEVARGGDRFKKIDIRPIVIPHRYNTRSELTAQISEDGDNAFNFELASK
jgi:hypothetical protein